MTVPRRVDKLAELTEREGLRDEVREVMLGARAAWRGGTLGNTTQDAGRSGPAGQRGGRGRECVYAH